MELLNVIYQNASMGIKGIDDIIHKIKSEKLLKIIKKERKEYLKILNESKKIAKSKNFKLSDVNFMAKMMAEVFSQFKTMKDDSDNEIIKMMIEGTYKSLTLINNEFLTNKDDNNIKNLADKFISILEDNIKELKNI